jgi:hypothetical protein
MVQLQKKWRGADGKVMRGYVPRRWAYYTVTAAADAFQMNPIMIHSRTLLCSVESPIIFSLSAGACCRAQPSPPAWWDTKMMKVYTHSGARNLNPSFRWPVFVVFVLRVDKKIVALSKFKVNLHSFTFLAWLIIHNYISRQVNSWESHAVDS